jgi:hypothetical protein
MNRCVALSLVLLAFAGCGRTEPVRGYEYFLPEVVPPPHDAGIILPTDAGHPIDGGVPVIIAGQCVGPGQTCPRGFHCEEGICVLNGDEAQLQVTLQWQNNPRTNDDLDLHLVEPLSSGSSCEIWFGSGGLFSCTSVGTLDLDANGACVDTDTSGGPGSDTENIIYPRGTAAPIGHYIARVDFWAQCSTGLDIPFVLTVRKGATVLRRTGVFHPGEADSGNEGSGITVLEFDVP